jgi:hypothetical protein
MKVTPQVPALPNMTPMGYRPRKSEATERYDTLLRDMAELAEELDKGNNADIGWLKYQGDLVRRAANLLLIHQGK